MASRRTTCRPAAEIETICREMAMQLNFDSDAPLYRQILENTENLIESGVLQAGDRLPPERRLMEILGVSRSTLRIALADLIQRKYISSTQGRGNFIQLPPRQRELRLLALERFQADHWTVTPIHYDWITKAGKAINARIHYQYVPTIEDLIHTLQSPPTGYDGLIIFRPLQEWSEALLKSPDALFEQCPIPLQIIGRPIQKRNLNTVTWDYFQASRLATAKLIQLGHRRIGYISGYPVLGHSFYSFYEGYKSAMSEAGLVPLEEDVRLIPGMLFKGGVTIPVVKESLIEFLQNHKFTAAVSALLTNPFERAIEQLKIPVPDRLSVMMISEEHSFNNPNISWSGYAEPSAKIVQRGISALAEICRGQRPSGNYTLISPVELQGNTVRTVE